MDSIWFVHVIGADSMNNFDTWDEVRGFFATNFPKIVFPAEPLEDRKGVFVSSEDEIEVHRFPASDQDEDDFSTEEEY